MSDQNSSSTDSDPDFIEIVASDVVQVNDSVNRSSSGSDIVVLDGDIDSEASYKSASDDLENLGCVGGSLPEQNQFAVGPYDFVNVVPSPTDNSRIKEDEKSESRPQTEDDEGRTEEEEEEDLTSLAPFSPCRCPPSPLPNLLTRRESYTGRRCRKYVLEDSPVTLVTTSLERLRALRDEFVRQTRCPNGCNSLLARDPRVFGIVMVDVPVQEPINHFIVFDNGLTEFVSENGYSDLLERPVVRTRFLWGLLQWDRDFERDRDLEWCKEASVLLKNYFTKRWQTAEPVQTRTDLLRKWIRFKLKLARDAIRRARGDDSVRYVEFDSTVALH
jgi:hypothetical protein